MNKYLKIKILIILTGIMFFKPVFASTNPVYNLDIKVLPEKKLLEGRAEIVVPAGGISGLTIGNLKIKKVKINGEEQNNGTDYIKKIISLKEKSTIEIYYLKKMVSERSNRKGTGAALTEFVLLSNWYPVVKDLCRYNLKVEMPQQFEVISESDSIVSLKKGNIKILNFKFDKPVPGITLVAGKYKVYEEIYRDVLIKTYFFSDDKDLSSSYIEKTKYYIDLYNSMLGKYPHGSFSIVENKYQTGYSFPTYTLLGSRVLRLPFIIDTSLGHEILHQWFGNYVYTDNKGGNWSEGLTAYLSDHWYRKLKGKGAEYRKKILINFSNYVKKNSEIALKNFIHRTGYSTKSVGYGKSSMLFHMLRKNIGDKKFFKGLKNFISNNKLKAVGWGSLKSSFDLKGDDVNNLFNHWIERKGTISFKPGNISVIFRKGKYILKFKILQFGDFYTFNLPLKVITENKTEKIKLHVNKKEKYFLLRFKSRPLKLIFDDEYDLMRKLSVSEKPAVISAIIGDNKTLVIAPDDSIDKYKYAIESFKKRGFVIKQEKEIKNKDIKAASIVFFSVKSKIYKRLFAGKRIPQAGAGFRVLKNPLAYDKYAMLINAENQGELRASFNKIFHYGSYSLLLFDKGRNIKKEVDETENGISISSGINIEAIETKSNLNIDHVIEKIKDKQIVYVGESHTTYSHHLVQYEIIKRLYKTRGNLIIGMEMFQQPFQQYLDRYISGDIDEIELLKKTEYFKRWGYDYNLYRDILHFARSKKIPVIALNLKSEIVKKVSKSGIDSLTPEEYSMIPGDIDMTNVGYRRHMRNVLMKHSRNLKLNIENFFQSQILWDETMAHNAVNAMKKYPEATMVLLAGNGHLENRWGIPDRVSRLSGFSHAVILNGQQSSINKKSADFVIIPSDVKVPGSPRLMVILKKKDGRLLIDNVLKNGPAFKAGLKKADIILTVDNVDIKNISDLKILLLNKNRGDIIKVKVERKKLFLLKEEIVKELKL